MRFFIFALLIRSKIFAINSRFSFKLSMGNSEFLNGKEKDEKVLFSIKPAGWKKFMPTLRGWKILKENVSC